MRRRSLPELGWAWPSQFLLLVLLLLLGFLPTCSLSSTSAGGGARNVPRGAGRQGPKVSHDFGTGDLGDETWRGVDSDRSKLDAVTFVPGDYPTLHEAVQEVMRRQKDSVIGQRTVISLRGGSHLMPRRFREVVCPGDTWPYYQTHEPRYLNGKKTRAIIPDDGSQPKTSVDHPCQWIPERDTRFLNITGPIQVLGKEDMTSRVCGAWRFHAPPATSGWLRELICVNQDEGVIFVDSASWKFDGCVFAACGRGEHATDIMILRGQSTAVASQCTFEVLRPDEPSPEWARWPPGDPKNGYGLMPIDISPLPQGGYAGVGVDAGTRSRVMMDRCLLQGLVCGILARDATDLSMDDCVLRWNQIGITMSDAPNVAGRTCTFTDNVYGAIYLEDASSIEGSVLSLMATDITGPQWGSEIRPGTIDFRHVTVRESAPEFLQEGAPGYHQFETLDTEDEWVPGQGVYDVPDWRDGNNTAGYDPYHDVNASGTSDGVGALLKDLTVRRRNAPDAFQTQAGDMAGARTGM